MIDTKESIAEEILAESFNPDTSDASTCDTRTNLIRMGATIITTIENLALIPADETETEDTGTVDTETVETHEETPYE